MIPRQPSLSSDGGVIWRMLEELLAPKLETVVAHHMGLGGATRKLAGTKEASPCLSRLPVPTSASHRPLSLTLLGGSAFSAFVHTAGNGLVALE